MNYFFISFTNDLIFSQFIPNIENAISYRNKVYLIILSGGQNDEMKKTIFALS